MAFDQMKYIKEYNRENIVYRKINLNLKNPDDQKIITWLDGLKESTSAYLKRLIFEDMKKQP